MATPFKTSNGRSDKTCFISIDVEQDVGIGIEKFQGIDNIDKILNVFRGHGVAATLFVTGEVLDAYKDKLHDLSKFYEIACHGYTHKFWDTLNSRERKEELENFISLYRDIFQKSPIGFRAPSHIIDGEGLQLLEESGFLCDSSIVPHYPPFKKYRGYKGKAPLSPYNLQGMRLLEIPNSGQLMGVPLAGAWIRKLPLLVYKILFLIYRPKFITLSMHSWDSLHPVFLKKLEGILGILEKYNYRFLNGEQILKNRR